MFFLEVHKCMDRIARFWQMELYIGGFNFVMIINRSPYHIKPVEFMKESFAWLEWVLGGYNHPDFLKVRCLRHNVSDNQVPNVDGIKGAKEQTDFQGLWISD